MSPAALIRGRLHPIREREWGLTHCSQRGCMSYVLSGIAIVICAGVGATSAWIIVSSIGWDGVGGAIATTIVGMVLATLLFAGGIVLGKALGLLK